MNIFGVSMSYSVLFLVLFMIMMVAIGLWGMFKTKTMDDFFLGGRSLGPWISAFAFGTTYFSAVLFIGFAGKLGWTFGLGALWIAVGNVIAGSLLAWLVLGKRTRRMTQNLDVMTMPEFFEERYGAPGLKILAAMTIFVFLLPYSASVYKGLGYLFEKNFDISYDTSLIVMTVITAAYLILGGYFAVTMTDFIQGIVMLFGAAAMVYFLAKKGGGVVEVVEHIRTAYPQHDTDGKTAPWYVLWSLVFMTSFGTWGMPQMVQKFYSIKDEKQIFRAMIISTAFCVIIAFGAYFVGSMTHVFYDQLPTLANGKPDFDRIIPDLLKTNLPEPLMGLILLLVLSASMSTLSSLILVSSSAIAIDLYKGHVNPTVSSKQSLTLIRFLSGIFIGGSYYIAQKNPDFIVTLMAISWGTVAGAFIAPYVYGIYWRRATKAAAYASFFCGAGLNIILYFALGKQNAASAASLAIIAPMVVFPIVSLLSPPPEKGRIVAAFDGSSEDKIKGANI